MHAQAADRSILPPLLFHDVRAYVTGYNTTPGQTDDTPCIAASGANICGRTDAVACPRRIGLGTFLEIRGVTYICEDRLAKKFDSRFDISCDKDTTCPGQVTGWADIKVFAENPCRLPPPSKAVATIARPVVRLAAVTRPVVRLASLVSRTVSGVAHSQAQLHERLHRWGRA